MAILFFVEGTRQIPTPRDVQRAHHRRGDQSIMCAACEINEIETALVMTRAFGGDPPPKFSFLTILRGQTARRAEEGDRFTPMQHNAIQAD